MNRPALSKTLRLALVLVLLGILAGSYVLFASLNNSHREAKREACERSSVEDSKGSHEFNVDQAICQGTVEP
jgi:hypothetical protein